MYIYTKKLIRIALCLAVYFFGVRDVMGTVNSLHSQHPVQISSYLTTR